MEDGRGVRALFVGKVPGNREDLPDGVDGREGFAAQVGDLRYAAAEVHGLRRSRIVGTVRRQQGRGRFVRQRYLRRRQRDNPVESGREQGFGARNARTRSGQGKTGTRE